MACDFCGLLKFYYREVSINRFIDYEFIFKHAIQKIFFSRDMS